MQPPPFSSSSRPVERSPPTASASSSSQPSLPLSPPPPRTQESDPPRTSHPPSTPQAQQPPPPPAAGTPIALSEEENLDLLSSNLPPGSQAREQLRSANPDVVRRVEARENTRESQKEERERLDPRLRKKLGVPEGSGIPSRRVDVRRCLLVIFVSISFLSFSQYLYTYALTFQSTFFSFSRCTSFLPSSQFPRLDASRFLLFLSFLACLPHVPKSSVSQH